MLIDLHAKSHYSEGATLSLDDVLGRARAAGLDGVLFADRLASAHSAEIIAAGARHNIATFVGVELPTDRGLLIAVVPTLGDFYEAEEWRALTDATTPSAHDVIALVESHQGAVIAARPYDLDIPFNMGDLIFTLDGLRGVEVLNSRVGDIQNDFALEAASFLGLSTVGGSDEERDGARIGRYATFFTSDITTQAELVAALREDEFWAVQLGGESARGSSRTSEPFAKRQGQERDERKPRDDRKPNGERPAGDRPAGGRSSEGRSSGGRSSGGRSSGGRSSGGRSSGGRSGKRD